MTTDETPPDAPRTRVHVVPPPPQPPAPAGEVPPAGADVRRLRPPSPPPPETVQLLREMVAHIKLSRGEISRLRSEMQDTSLALAQIVEDYMRRQGEQLDAHTKALSYLVDKLTALEAKP